tara:strand:+ start:184761 stop:185015 length:255 start_codon:yes stop_codon:yes gene_type:complete
MTLTAELSLYPLQENYISIIQAFIEDLRSEDLGLTVVTNAMSTQICGDWDIVMSRISKVLHSSYEAHGRQVLVCKLIPGQLDIN